MKEWVSRKVRFIKATSERDAHVTRATVELERLGVGVFVGRLERPSTTINLPEAGAQAAADAVERASGMEGTRVVVQDVARTTVFEEPVVVVSVSATARGETFSLYGVSHVDGDVAEAAALAVLNATNRVCDLA